METFKTLLQTPPAKRDDVWEKSFLAEFPKVEVKILNPEPQQGPDGWPYLFVATGDGADEPILNVLGWLSEKGIGLAVNPHKAAPDFVLTYGMIWNYRERGEFLSASPRAEASREPIQLTNGQEILVGPPSEVYLPRYARAILKQFLLDQGAFAPKVNMVSFDKQNYDLCFSIESLKSPPEKEHEGIAEAISWFLPAHYVVSLVSEKAVSGFQPL